MLRFEVPETSQGGSREGACPQRRVVPFERAVSSGTGTAARSAAPSAPAGRRTEERGGEVRGGGCGPQEHLRRAGRVTVFVAFCQLGTQRGEVAARGCLGRLRSHSWHGRPHQCVLLCERQTVIGAGTLRLAGQGRGTRSGLVGNARVRGNERELTSPA